MRHRKNPVNHWRWYVVGVKEGKKWLLGGYFTESEADEKAYEFFKEAPFTKHYLKTTDRNRASSILRHKFLESGEEYSYIAEKFKHPSPTIINQE